MSLAVNPLEVFPCSQCEVAVDRIVDNWLLNGFSHISGSGFLEVQRQNVFAAFGCISSTFLGMYA